MKESLEKEIKNNTMNTPCLPIPPSFLLGDSHPTQPKKK